MNDHQPINHLPKTKGYRSAGKNFGESALDQVYSKPFAGKTSVFGYSKSDKLESVVEEKLEAMLTAKSES